MRPDTDLTTPTVLPCFTRFYCFSYSRTVDSSFLTIFRIIFSELSLAVFPETKSLTKSKVFANFNLFSAEISAIREGCVISS